MVDERLDQKNAVMLNCRDPGKYMKVSLNNIRSLLLLSSYLSNFIMTNLFKTLLKLSFGVSYVYIMFIGI